MSIIFIVAGVFLWSAYRYIRAYNSDDEKYSRLAGSPHLKPSSLFMTSTHTVLFGFPPVFGAATAFLIYEQLGGEVNFISIFLLLLALVLGPYFLVKKFNDHKQARSKSPHPNPKFASAEVVFTRGVLSPEKYRLYRRMAILQFSLLVLILVVVVVMNALKHP